MKILIFRCSFIILVKILSCLQKPDKIILGIDPGTGLAQGGGGEVNAGDIVRLPGVNAPVVQTTNEDGPRVPEGVEVQ